MRSPSLEWRGLRWWIHIAWPSQQLHPEKTRLAREQHKLNKIENYLICSNVYDEPNIVELVKPADALFPAPLEEGLPYDIYSTFIVSIPATEDAVEETEGDVQPDEQPEAEPPVDPLAGYCMDDVKSVLGEVTNEMIGQLQIEINGKLQMQEEAYSVRIEKLKKS
uniref:Uncharacterized protein n=1 Tax=Sphaerodactylus townsendi TaxID=933632 RepID=A0ACB8F907_9SAUR